jgi:hypothetical protein
MMKHLESTNQPRLAASAPQVFGDPSHLGRMLFNEPGAKADIS